MTIFKKAISLILVLILSFTVTVPAFARGDKEPRNLSEYTEMLWDEGYEPLSADAIVDVLQQFNIILSILTFGKVEVKNFNLTMDKFTTDLFRYIFNNSGFDITSILQNLPDINVPANIAVETFKIDTTVFREEMYRKRAECDEQGNGELALIYHFLGVYFSVIEECQIFGEKTEDKNIYELSVRLIFKDGTEEIIRPGIFINTETGECTNRDDSGMVGVGFNFSLAEMTLYATVNCWMRDFGFCLFYDIIAQMIPVVYKYETRRFKFDYDGLQWMIQIWKGNYFVTNGGEVGLYYRTPQKYGTFYKCADDEKMMPMTLKVSHGDTVLINKPQQNHWWINGFHMNGKMYLPESLTMEFSLVMPDKKMLDAFCESIDNNYQKDVSYTTDGLKVNVVW